MRSQNPRVLDIIGDHLIHRRHVSKGNKGQFVKTVMAAGANLLNQKPVQERGRFLWEAAMMEINMQRTVSPMWGAVVWSGIGASVLFLIIQTLLVWLVVGISPWAPPRAIAALVMGPNVLQPATFDAGILAVAVFIHFIIAIVLAGILTSVIVHFDMRLSLLIGAVYGFLLYLVAFYGLTALFPWLAIYRGWVSLVSYIVFGFALAGSYKILDRRSSTIH